MLAPTSRANAAKSAHHRRLLPRRASREATAGLASPEGANQNQFCLEPSGGSALTAVAMSLSLPPTTLLDSLAAYPRWFVVACLTIVVAVGIWLLAKVLKWSLYLLMVVVLIAGAATTVWLVFK